MGVGVHGFQVCGLVWLLYQFGRLASVSLYCPIPCVLSWSCVLFFCLLTAFYIVRDIFTPDGI